MNQPQARWPSILQADMNLAELRLRALRIEDEAAFRKAVHEFARIEPGWPFAFSFDASQSFSLYVQKLERWREGKDLPKEFVPNTFLVGIVGDEIVGRVSIRHVLNDFLERYGGHIGYGVVPSRRNRGYASEMLRQSLLVASALGLQKVLVTSDDDNPASIRVIEKNRGVLEDIVSGPEVDIPKRRYWITIGR